MYKILMWTPFYGVYKPIPHWQLIDAEYRLGLNKKHYHERAVLIENVLHYPLAPAEEIVDYWRAKYPFAEFQLKLRVGEFE